MPLRFHERTSSMGTTDNHDLAAAVTLGDTDTYATINGATHRGADVTGAQLKTFVSSGLVNVTAATLTVTAASHGGRAVTLNRAAGQAITLPAASGGGNIYTFIVGTTITSNSTTIKVANASDAFIGFSMVVSDDAGGPVIGFIASAASDDTVTLNGTTTGGYAGDTVVIEDVAANVFAVRIFGKATGTEATPFSATVS